MHISKKNHLPVDALYTINIILSIVRPQWLRHIISNSGTSASRLQTSMRERSFGGQRRSLKYDEGLVKQLIHQSFAELSRRDRAEEVLPKSLNGIVDEKTIYRKLLENLWKTLQHSEDCKHTLSPLLIRQCPKPLNDHFLSKNVHIK